MYAQIFHALASSFQGKVLRFLLRCCAVKQTVIFGRRSDRRTIAKLISEENITHLCQGAFTLFFKEVIFLGVGKMTVLVGVF